MRVVFPAYSMRNFDWDRICAVLKPIAEHCSMQVFYTEDVRILCDWARFVRVSPVPHLYNLDAILRYAVEVISELDDFDLLYCFTGGPYYQLLSVAIAKMANKPIVMHVNGDGALARKFHCSNFTRFREDVTDTIGLNNVDALVPISSILAEKLRSKVKDTTRITQPVPFSVDTNRFKPYDYLENVVLGYSGRLSPEKGCDFLMKLIKETPDTRYKIAGPIQSTVQFPDNTHYIGCLPLCEMPMFYNSTSVTVLPSYGEGMPGSVLESYACGRPVICTPESRPEELKLFGWELERDLELWKSRIESLTAEECQSMGLKARKWITKEYPSWQDFGLNMKKIFDSV